MTKHSIVLAIFVSAISAAPFAVARTASQTIEPAVAIDEPAVSEADVEEQMVLCDDAVDSEAAAYIDAESETETAAAPCKNEECSVQCGHVPPNAGGACRFETTGCTFVLTQQTCDLFGYKTGQTLPVDGTREKPLPTAPPTPKPEEVANTCVMRHEAQHACDGRGMPGPETERNGSAAELQCLKDAQQQYCSPAAPDAQTLCGYLGGAVVAKTILNNYHQCKLNGITPRDCESLCERNFPGNEKQCNNTCALYDPTVCKHKD